MSRPLPDALAVYCHELEPEMRGPFREMARWFTENGYRFVDYDGYHQGVGKRVFLSFDDNHRAWFESLDLFDEFGIKALFYTNTVPFDPDRPSDEPKAMYDRIGWQGRREPMTAGELREVRARGHEIGAHTHTHRNLAELPFEEACREIDLSREWLERLLGEPVRHFSYPFGTPRAFSGELADYVRQSGMTIAHALPGMQFAPPVEGEIHRSYWQLALPVEENLRYLAVDGKWFAEAFRKSPLGGY